MSMQYEKFREFEDGETVAGLGYDIVIERRNLGRLHMPTGELVACDPLHDIESEPFDTALEPGAYQTVLFAADLRDEKLIAYAMLNIGEKPPIRWEAATVGGGGDNPFDPYETDGYPVDGSLGCFMDAETAKVLMDYSHSVMEDDDEFRRVLRGRVRRRLERGYGWANVNLKHDAKVPQAEGHHNVIAFDAGYGPGLYTTYIGWDEDDEISRIVTDFEVLDFRFNTFPFGG